MIFGPQESVTILHKYLEHLEKDDDSGIGFGVPSVDKTLMKLQDNDFVTVLARPSNGKSVVVVHYCRRASEQYKANQDKYSPPVLISLEGPVEEVMMRNLSNYTAIDSKIIRNGKQQNNWKELHESADKMIAEFPMTYIAASSYSTKKKQRITLSFVEDAMKKIVDVYGKKPRMIGLDYIQLLSMDNGSSDRRIMLSECVLRIKELGSIYGCPVVMASQANREAETQQKFAIPQPYHSKDTGSIEEASDIILSLMRPCKYYKIGDLIPYTSENVITTPYLFFVNICKQRNGDTYGYWIEMDARIGSLSDGEIGVPDEN